MTETATLTAGLWTRALGRIGSRPRILFGAAMAWMALFFAAKPIGIALTPWNARDAYWSYAAGQNQLTWFNTGFARRELLGTLQSLIPAEPMYATCIAHLIGYAALAACLIAAIVRRPLTMRTFALGAVALAILARLGDDVGRPDAAVMVCGLAAAWASRRALWPVAAVALAVGLAFHETGLIVLGPLALAVALESGALTRWRSLSAAVAAILMVATLGLYVVASLAKPDVHALARSIHARFAYPTLADIAVYFDLSGLRGLGAAICQAALDRNYSFEIACGLAVPTLLAATLRPGRLFLTFAVAALPFLALSAIAIDVGRWAVFGVFSILALSLAEREPEIVPPKRAALALLVLPLMALDMSSRSPFAPIPLFDAAAQRHNHTLEPLAGINDCDPGWRQFLGLAP